MFLTRRKLAFAALAAGCALVGSAPAARADAAPHAEVLVIHGTDCETPHVDPGIGEVPPLKYKCYKLLETKQLALTQGAPSTMPLANGRTFQLVYNGKTGDTPPRYKLSASINKVGGPGFQPLADVAAEHGKKFHVGGFAYQNGALILAIRVL
ncbi:MAG: hypothetical protein KF819_36095 [Labilithrix sp.]|nr:hypothetical protein [Labilithrix sp.]